MRQIPERPKSVSSSRIAAVDILRGAVMVLMTLDHTRDFFSSADFSPTDLSRTSTALFLTRWITHFCAPVFIFLAGASAYLSSAHYPDKQRPSRFLLTRGLWILFLGITFESLIWCFTPDFSEICGSVLWAIGWSMIALAALIFLPLPLTVLFGLVMIGGHNFFDSLSQRDLGSALGPLWAILHSGERVPITGRLLFHPSYPLIPWIGVMAVGYGFGRLLLLEKSLQDKALFTLGSILIFLFILLRYSNVYGDPKPWAPQHTAAFTLWSFLNCHKYPPSLSYLLMTLGPAIAVLPMLERLVGRFGSVLQIFGRTPMFFYLLHLPLLVMLALAHAFISGGTETLLSEPGFPDGFPQAYGYGLPVVYLIWLGVVALLYPVCLWFSRVKRLGSNPLLKYL